jgi:hypothetical protein
MCASNAIYDIEEGHPAEREPFVEPRKAPKGART